MSKPTSQPSQQTRATYSAPRPVRVGARAVGAFVPQLTKKAFEKYGFSMASLLLDWARIAGPALARDTIPERLKWPRLSEAAQDGIETSARPGATLVLRVDPARALDVQYGTRQLTERINAYFGYRAVTEVRIVQGPLTPDARPAEPMLRASTLAPVKPVPAATTAVQSVGDEALRAALARMAAGIARDAKRGTT